MGPRIDCVSNLHANECCESPKCGKMAIKSGHHTMWKHSHGSSSPSFANIAAELNLASPRGDHNVAGICGRFGYRWAQP